MTGTDQHKNEIEAGVNCKMTNCHFFSQQSKQNCSGIVLGQNAFRYCIEYSPETKAKQTPSKKLKYDDAIKELKILFIDSQRNIINETQTLDSEMINKGFIQGIKMAIYRLEMNNIE